MARLSNCATVAQHTSQTCVSLVFWDLKGLKLCNRRMARIANCGIAYILRAGECHKQGHASISAYFWACRQRDTLKPELLTLTGRFNLIFDKVMRPLRRHAQTELFNPRTGRFNLRGLYCLLQTSRRSTQHQRSWCKCNESRN